MQDGNSQIGFNLNLGSIVQQPGAEDRNPGRENNERQTADDLIGFKRNTDNGMHQPQQHAGQDCPQESHPRTAGGVGNGNGREGTGQHHALQTDVHHPGALRVSAAQSGQYIGNCQSNTGGEDGEYRIRHGLTSCCFWMDLTTRLVISPLTTTKIKIVAFKTSTISRGTLVETSIANPP